jgi:hypothetical protein
MRIDVKKILSLSQKDKFDYLRKNEKDLIKTKCSTEDVSDVISIPSKLVNRSHINKSKIDNNIENDVVRVAVVANTSNWIDSQLDMILPDAVNKSLKDKKNNIPHLHDHERSTTAKIGEVVDIYMDNVNYSELGLQGNGIASVLIFETDVRKDYNENIYNQYKNNGITQHSIGLRYINMVLAMNDVNDPEHLKNWNEYINQAINKEVALSTGYFWIVKEYKLIENSAVLFGANELTPTLRVTQGKSIEYDENYLELIERLKALELKAVNDTLNDKPLSDEFVKQTINSIKNFKF